VNAPESRPLPVRQPQLPEPLRSAVDWQALAGHCRGGGGPDAGACRELIQTADHALAEAFRIGQDIETLVTGRALMVDFVLESAWNALGLSQAGHLSLIAVGGYGRGELHPRSDVDLLILRAEHLPDPLLDRLQRFVGLLWDLGLPVGHSVRTLQECVAEAQADVTVMTNLLESRLLAGETRAFTRLTEAIGPEHIWPAAAFFEAKMAEQRRRHHKFGDSAYKLEPNVKEGPGGLRDIQTVAWVAQRHLGVRRLHELVPRNFLTEDEYADLMEGRAWLWRVRFALHLLTGRAEERLLFEYQPELARQFGYHDSEHDLAVEQFMQRHFRTVTDIERLSEMLLQHEEEELLASDEGAAPIPINRRFQVYKGFLETTGADVFRRYPSALLELFLVLQEHPEIQGVRAGTVRLIRQHRHRIDDAYRKDLRNRSLFMEILRQPAGVSHELRRMNRYGILAAYLPAFAHIVGRMQYDLFHVYTVDEHILMVLRNVRRFALPAHAQENPLCHAIFERLPKPEILYLAALFHDIGKGRGGDHSEIGAREAERFCLDHGLSAFDSRKVAWLVRHHLLMSMTAQRKDINDPEVVNRFAEQVGNINRLNYLYLLTVADIQGTNPELWNPWRASLLSTLYHNTLRVLRRGLDNPLLEREVIEEARAGALERLASEGIDVQAVEQLWQRFGREYFLRHSAEEIAWHTAALLGHEQDTPVVLARRSPTRGCTDIFIYTRDHPHLFSRVTTVLSNEGLNIVDARIITTADGYTLDTYAVLDQDDERCGDPDRMAHITLALTEALSRLESPPKEVARRTPRRLRHFRSAPSVHFEQDPRSGHTRIELSCLDYPGLLSKVGRAFAETGVMVHSARIATLGERVEDLFYVSDTDGRPIADPRRQERIHEAIVRAIGELDRE